MSADSTLAQSERNEETGRRPFARPLLMALSLMLVSDLCDIVVQAYMMPEPTQLLNIYIIDEAVALALLALAVTLRMRHPNGGFFPDFLATLLQTILLVQAFVTASQIPMSWSPFESETLGVLWLSSLMLVVGMVLAWYALFQHWRTSVDLFDTE